MYYINFSYSSPHDDVAKSTGINSDGTVNVKYTLLTLKNLLMENVEKINKLLENTDKISDISVAGYNQIQVSIYTETDANQLKDSGIIVSNLISDNVDEFEFPEPEETNHERFQMLHNITNPDVVGIIDSTSVDSDAMKDVSEQKDDVIYDEKNLESIIKKYQILMSNKNHYPTTEDSEGEESY